MPKGTNNLPKKPPGRPKGSKDKIQKNLKQLVLDTIDSLEKAGKDLHSEAMDDPKWFFANFVKPMLPKDVIVTGDEDGGPMIVKIERVIIDKPTDTNS